MTKREIKFRGKREDNGEWVFGSFIPDALEGGNSDLVSWGFIRRYNRDVSKMETIEVDRETVGQYTGLKDREGVEIYEGDVLIFDGYKFVILWNEERGGFRMDYWMFDEQCDLSEFSQTSEIISNIHDDPELMEEA